MLAAPLVGKSPLLMPLIEGRFDPLSLEWALKDDNRKFVVEKLNEVYNNAKKELNVDGLQKMMQSNDVKGMLKFISCIPHILSEADPNRFYQAIAVETMENTNAILRGLGQL